MKSYFLLLSFVLASTSAAIANTTTQTPTEKTGFLMKVDFQFKKAKKSFQVKHDSIIAEDNKHWTPLTPAKDGVALLGKMKMKSDGIIMLEYMVVDTSVNPVHVQSMSVISNIGQTASITSSTLYGADTDKITVNLTPEPTTYTEKPISK